MERWRSAMSKEICILTTKDLTILEVMLDRCLYRDDPMASLLKRKINSALVMFREDVPENVATLSSRVTFSVDGRDPHTRIISHDRMTSSIGLFLPITCPRGLALLGLSEGQEFRMPNNNGVEERILIEKVHYQPEAAKRERDARARLSEPRERRLALRLIRDTFYGRPQRQDAEPDGFDGPEPPAA
jgi:regulator of nucleoside diphosphate kinase